MQVVEILLHKLTQGVILVASFVSWCLQPFFDWPYQMLPQTPLRMCQSCKVKATLF